MPSCLVDTKLAQRLSEGHIVNMFQIHFVNLVAFARWVKIAFARIALTAIIAPLFFGKPPNNNNLCLARQRLCRINPFFSHSTYLTLGKR